MRRDMTRLHLAAKQREARPSGVTPHDANSTSRHDFTPSDETDTQRRYVTKRDQAALRDATILYTAAQLDSLPHDTAAKRSGTDQSGTKHNGRTVRYTSRLPLDSTKRSGMTLRHGNDTVHGGVTSQHPMTHDTAAELALTRRYRTQRRYGTKHCMTKRPNKTKRYTTELSGSTCRHGTYLYAAARLHPTPPHRTAHSGATAHNAITTERHNATDRSQCAAAKLNLTQHSGHAI